MNTSLDNTLRANLKTLLQAAMREQSIAYTDLIAQTGLDLRIIGNATAYGVVDAIDLVAICRALDLDAGAVLSEAVNHIGAELSSAPSAPSAVNPAAQQQPEVYPS
jgi:hypothetical protein